MNTKFWKQLSCLMMLLGFSVSALADETNGYVGKIGQQNAEFTLTWNASGKVNGTYHCPGGSGRVYVLRGSNPKEGELVLHEYTNGVHSATCYLTKSTEQGKVVWRGVMHNNDGRDKAIYFYRGKQRKYSNLNSI